ncbi:hypothetical protein E2320_015505 [Naja naja]|nr:hypothetical protein E2320_015505 [Naja naja]
MHYDTTRHMTALSYPKIKYRYKSYWLLPGDIMTTFKHLPSLCQWVPDSFRKFSSSLARPIFSPENLKELDNTVLSSKCKRQKKTKENPASQPKQANKQTCKQQMIF